MNPHFSGNDGDWEERYAGWFEKVYGVPYQGGDPKEQVENLNDGDYYEHEESTEIMIWDLEDREDRKDFRQTLSQILAWRVTLNCPESEWSG